MNDQVVDLYPRGFEVVVVLVWAKQRGFGGNRPELASFARVKLSGLNDEPGNRHSVRDVLNAPTLPKLRLVLPKTAANRYPGHTIRIAPGLFPLEGKEIEFGGIYDLGELITEAVELPSSISSTFQPPARPRERVQISITMRLPKTGESPLEFLKEVLEAALGAVNRRLSS